jgi:hypothetical protein
MHDAFLLVFRGPLRPRLPQGTHLMEHGALGRSTLLLVPGSMSRTGAEYTATVNRLHGEGRRPGRPLCVSAGGIAGPG